MLFFLVFVIFCFGFREVFMKKVLFVCLGNICRSPAAEAVFNKFLKECALPDTISCDSSGTYGEMAGTPADSRMVRAAKRRGIDINHISRHTQQSDFEKFDYIIGMDEQNIKKLEKIRANFGGKAKILRMAQFIENRDTHIPDPYYGDESDFEYVLDLLDVGCANLLDFLK
jgi:protein-tyrosine phosphatase